MTSTERSSCVLRLSTGEAFTGELIGAPVEASGEMVFTTGMVGYSEALTDPSYFGQILVFTYPLIGNYGVPPLERPLDVKNSQGFESERVHASAVIVAVASPSAFHWSSGQTLHDWLFSQGVAGIAGLDPRHLVHLMREHRPLFGRVEPQAKASTQRPIGISWQGDYFDPSEHNILPYVATREPKILGKGKRRICVIDCGVKWNILRQLIDLECEVVLTPFDADLQKVDCSAWLLSNGPGDPRRTGDLVERLAPLLQESRPILGICLGHQLIALAAGANTVKLPYGHRSHNQPVYEAGTTRGYITSQNHGYVVEEKSLPRGWRVWFRNANDETVEGLAHESKPFRTVQFHPEASGGPRDTGWIIEKFVAGVR